MAANQKAGRPPSLTKRRYAGLTELAEIDVSTSTVAELERVVNLAEKSFAAWLDAVRKRLDELKTEAW